jgi:hypothetical protein
LAVGAQTSSARISSFEILTWLDSIKNWWRGWIVASI